MGILDRIFNRGRSSGAEATVLDSAADPVEDHECVHVALTAHWDEPGDMGVEDRATSFECGSCGAVFTPAETRELRATEAARLKSITSN